MAGKRKGPKPPSGPKPRPPRKPRPLTPGPKPKAPKKPRPLKPGPKPRAPAKGRPLTPAPKPKAPTKGRPLQQPQPRRAPTPKPLGALPISIQAPTQPSKTRATKTHNDARARLDKREKEVRRLLVHAKKEKRKEALKAELAAIEQHRAWIGGGDLRGAAPVGALAGSPRIEMDKYRGSSSSWSEPRYFGSGAQLLGYLEGRPGVTSIIAVQPGAIPPGERPDLPQEIKDRIANLDMVQNAAPEDQAAIRGWIEDAYDYADYEGAEVETEIDYEKAAS